MLFLEPLYILHTTFAVLTNASTSLEERRVVAACEFPKGLQTLRLQDAKLASEG
jgi:hypothetical protein